MIVLQGLPPPPDTLVGRDSIMETLLAALAPALIFRCAIVGLGGLGKTAIATKLLHDPVVLRNYPTRLFISCEECLTIDLLFNTLANELSLSQTDNSSILSSHIIRRIRERGKTLIVMDNLEVVWNVDTEQAKVDAFLNELSALGSDLALLVTMRGTLVPKTSFKWHKVPLSALGPTESLQVYEATCNQTADPAAIELLSKLGGMPLAIKIFARLVEGGDRTIDLLEKWRDQGPTAFENGTPHRLSSLDHSISLSVFSSHIDESSRFILGLLACIPDGLHDTPDNLVHFQSILPTGHDLSRALQVLRHAALIDCKGTPPRYQMLPPIQEFCRRFLKPPVDTLVSFQNPHLEVSSTSLPVPSRLQKFVITRMPSFRNLIVLFVTFAAICYAPYARSRQDAPIDACTRAGALLSHVHALPPSSKDHAGLADAHIARGKSLRGIGQFEAAEASYVCALQLYTRIEDLPNIAKTHRLIGDAQKKNNKLEAAELSYNRTLHLFSELGDTWWIAESHRSLGNLWLRRGSYEAANSSYSLALQLHSQLNDRRGLANTHVMIGQLQYHTNQLDGAENSFHLAIALYLECNNPEVREGLATSYKSLGTLQAESNRTGAAEASYNHALRLYTEIPEPRLAAGTHVSLGDLLKNMSRFDDAVVSYNGAVELYRGIESWKEAIQTHLTIGALQMDTKQIGASNESYSQALQLCTKTGTHDRDWLKLTADIHHNIGRLRELTNEFDAAEASYHRALPIYGEIGDLHELAGTHLRLGQVRALATQPDAAETSYRRAAQLFLELDNRHNAGYTFGLIGHLLKSVNRFDAAEASYLRAMQLYTEINATDMNASNSMVLGDLYTLQPSVHFEAAESSYKSALAYYASVKDWFWLARIYISLGDLYATQPSERLDESESFYSSALPLYQELDEQPLLATTHARLGDLLLHKRNDYERSAKHYAECSRISSFLGHTEQSLRCFKVLGIVQETRYQVQKIEIERMRQSHATQRSCEQQAKEIDDWYYRSLGFTSLFGGLGFFILLWLAFSS
ncbi:hypothetical protein DL96DRAFT_858540 [Flagelloscypha sp. PMI_526]|nr:hypothetical protein DL96DRAFT_858540 [Flagelloscypha sp. PMI_526]